MRNAVEEGDLCNICRGGEEDGGEGLMHPCLCKGSVGFVHQSCLTQWLAVSATKKCQLCNHLYEFTNIYSDQPTTLPPLLLVKGAITTIFTAGILFLRSILVITTWLAILPFIVCWVLRTFLWTSNSLVRLMNSPIVHNETVSEILKFNRTTLEEITNSTLTVAAKENVLEVPSYWMSVFNATTADILTGQIVTSTIIVIFVIGFLFREWILQNAQNAQNIPAEPEAAYAHLALAQQLLAAPRGNERALTVEEIRARTGIVVGQLPAIVPGENIRHLLEQYVEEEEEEDEDYIDEDFGEDEDMELDWEEEEPTMEASTSRLAAPAVTAPIFNGSNQPFSFDFKIASTGKEVDFEEESVEETDDEDEEEKEVVPNKSKGKARLFEDDADNVNFPAPSARSQRAHKRNAMKIRGEIHPRRLIKKLPASVRKSSSSSINRIPAVTTNRQVLPPPLDAHEAGLVFGVQLPRPVPVPRGLGRHEDFEEAEGGDRFFEDFDGVLEAVGMKGSILTLVQNASLMILLLTACLGVAIFVPLSLGRLLASTNAVRLLLLPVRAIRTVSDPIFDAGFKLIFAALKIPFGPISRVFGHYFSMSAGSSIPTSTSPSYLSKVIAHIATLIQSTFITVTPARVQAAAKLVMKLPGLPREALMGMKSLWNNMGRLDSINVRVANVALGYFTVLGSGLLYLSGTGETGEINRAFHNVVAQQLILFKVISFVFIEIVAFPSVCGLIINAVTIPLFPETTLVTRIAYYSRSPFSAFFLTWLGGTSFMFSFSLAIDSIRGAMRTGVLWFIRNPSSEFHPLREIMNRKALAQFKKIATSIVLYGGVILSVFGSAVLFLKYFIVTILPLNWSYQSYSYVSFDLIVVITIIPLTLDRLDLRASLHKAFIKNVNNIARALRLSSLLFGKRQSNEEITPDGSFARVPSTDNIRIRPGRKMFIPCQEDGTPLTEEGRGWISEQVLEMVTLRKNDQYQIIYLPKNWKWRVAGFVFLNWASAMLVALSGFVTLLLSGRFLFSYLVETPKNVHDIHSIILGGYFVLGCTYTTRFILSGFKTTPRQILLVIQSAFLLVTLPILLSLVMHCYIFLSFKKDSSTIPTFSVPSLFAQGLLIGSILVQITWRTRLFKSVKAKFEEVKILWEAEEKMRGMEMLISFLFTIILRILLSMVFGPLGCIFAFYLGSEVRGQQKFVEMARIGYRMAGVCFLFIGFKEQIEKGLIAWVASVRESEFLIERKLKNYIAPLAL